MERGLFIVLEGGEGVGKTTQWTRLAEVLTQGGHEVRALREPGGTPLGDELRRLLLDSTSTLCAEAEALLFSASRAQLVNDLLVPALRDGTIVLVDRFLLSTYAYQGAGRGLRMDALRNMSLFATRGVIPDLTLLLTMNVRDALERANARGESDRMEQESQAFHQRVAAAFEDATDPAWQDLHPEIGPVERVDATGTTEEVMQRCLAALAARWPERFGRLVDSQTIEAAFRA